MDKMDRKTKSDTEWKKELPEESYRVARLKATEKPFSGKYTLFKKEGTYHCICCNAQLFHSSTKFDSGTGWPSFHSAIQKNINTKNRSFP